MAARHERILGDSDSIGEDTDAEMQQRTTVINKQYKIKRGNGVIATRSQPRTTWTGESDSIGEDTGKRIQPSITNIYHTITNAHSVMIGDGGLIIGTGTGATQIQPRTTWTDGLSESEFIGDGYNRPTNWKRGEHIGSGGFGKVYEVEYSFLHMDLAVKQVIGCQQDSEKEKAALLKELQILKGLSHPRIVQFYGFCEADAVLSLFMERINGGSLDKYLNDESKKPLDASSIRSILRQMLEGVSYLHSKRILHRDIKSGNILMDEHLQIKLADFGVSKVFQEISKATTKPIGTTRWMAPEMFYSSNDYSYEVDIWAIGCTVVEMLTRKRPFNNLEREPQVLLKLMTNDPSPAYDLPETCPQNLRDFLNEVFQKNGSKRPSAKHLLLSNPFVTDGLNPTSNWKRGRHIGSGGFGKVYEVEDSLHYRKMAVKQVKECQQDNKKEKDALLMELKILKKLSHPKIVKYYGFCEAEGVLSLFMERIMGGSLEDYLKDKAKSPLDTSGIRAITRQMLEGVFYLHSNRTIHRDIKSGNVLMDEHFLIKLADFGVSRVFQDLSKATTKHIGTTRWMAPERIDDSKDYSYEVDIWALGCTVIEMVTRKYPFHNLKEEQNVMFRLLDPKRDPSPAYDLPETCPKELRDFFTVVFQKDVSKRPTANDLLCSNPFVNGNNGNN